MKNIEQSPLVPIIPLEYWESCDGRQGGVLGDITEKSLFIHSYVEMRIGSEFQIKIFFSAGSGFDSFELLGKIVGKDLCCVEGWEAYEYEIEFVRMSEEGSHKLRHFLRNRQEKRT
jgi:hypothetical protein